MLHLEAGVHLHEIELLRLQVEDELHRARAHVADLPGDRGGMAKTLLAQGVRQRGGTRLLDQFLVVPLHAAIAQAQNAHRSVLVAQHLDLDVAKRDDALLQVAVRVAEGALRLDADLRERVPEVLRPVDPANALAATAVDRLEHHRKTDRFRHFERRVRVGEDALAARHDRDTHLHRGLDRVRLVAHPPHRVAGRADEVQTVPPAEVGERGALGQEADPRMERVDLFPLGDPNHRVGVQVALIGSAAADADQAVAFPKHRRRRRLDIGIRLDQHNFHAGPLGDPHQLGRGATPRMDQSPPHRARSDRRSGLDGFRLPPAPTRRQELDPPLLLQEPLKNILDRLLRHRNLRIDVTQVIVEILAKGMLHETFHRTFDLGQVVRQRRGHRQVRRHDDLAGERHIRTREVVGLDQRVGHQARLGPAGAVAVAEADHRQVVVAHEPRDAIVHDRHGEQGAGAFLRQHAAGRDEAHDRQPLLGAAQQELAELLRTRHVERAGLERQVGDQNADPAASGTALRLTRRAGPDPGQRRHRSARRDSLFKRPLDRDPESREAHRIGGHPVRLDLLHVGEEAVQDGPGTPRRLPLLLGKHVLEQQIAVGRVKPVPEVLDADVARGNAAVVGADPLLVLVEVGQQALEKERDQPEQRLGDAGHLQPLPFRDGLEQPAPAGVAGEVPQPGTELPAQPRLRLGGLLRIESRRQLAERRVQRVAQQQVNRLAGDHVLFPRFSRDLSQVQEDVIVEPVERDEILALAPEQRQELRLENHVEHGEVRGIRSGAPGSFRGRLLQRLSLDGAHDIQQPTEVVLGRVLPLVVEVEAELEQQLGSSTIEVVLAAAQQERGEPSPPLMQRVTGRGVALVGPVEHVVVPNGKRVLEPALEGQAALPVPARLGRPGGNLGRRQPTVAGHGGRRESAAQPQVAQIAKGDTEDVDLLRRTPQARQRRHFLEGQQTA